jgi:competence protein ComEA
MSPVWSADPGKSQGSGAININTASVDELVKLPKVGEKVAARIVQYRQEHGDFKQPEDLKAVQGIGDKVFENIRPMITVK